MSLKIERRHSRWYEAFTMSFLFQSVLGLFLVVVLPAVLFWNVGLDTRLDSDKVITLAALAVAFLVSFFALSRLRRYAMAVGGTLSFIAPVVVTVFLITFAVLLFTHGQFSRKVLGWGFAITLLWFFICYFVARRYRCMKFALIAPDADKLSRLSHPQVSVRLLSTPDFHGVRFDAVIADLQNANITPEWERFLAQCGLAKLPVIHFRYIEERISGKVSVEHLSENELGTLSLPPLYSLLKRAIDIIGVLLVLPVALPLMLLTAVAIRLDSSGPAIFRQCRVGKGDKDFTVYKFRSMRVDAEKDGAKMASENDNRITRVGHIIRKTRLDELPQLWNVLKGDMSLIGPRPEQRVFVNQFSEEIPFYSYRHVVRPGVTGWAQVTQGYVADAEDTKVKLQHDLYYIKRLSLWLDILIVLKTLKVIISGHGAR